MQHHIRLGAEHLAGNGAMGRTVFLPGSPQRAARIAEHFRDARRMDNPRGLHAHLGVLELDGRRLDVLALPSGMGTGSTEIVMQELLAIGARRVVRVGSAGGMDLALKAGDVCVLSGAVRDEQTTADLVPRSVPALSHPAAVQAMLQGAWAAGLQDRCFVGMGHTKASLFAREFGLGPLGERNLEHSRALVASGVLASEMEASVLMVLASIASAGHAAPLSAGNAAVPVQAACVLGIYAGSGHHGPLDPEICQLADQRAIRVALHGAMAWAQADGLP